jgi:hypothetical protein
MAGNRKKAQEFLLKYIRKIEGGDDNAKLYEERFKSMSDKEFDALMTQIENDDFVFPMIAPTFSKTKISTERNVKIGKELGFNFFTRLRLTDEATGEEYLTPLEYLVIDLPFRRQSQVVAKKMSTAGTGGKIDDLTDQPIGESKSSAISFPEVQVLQSLGLSDTLTELMKVRGGDQKAFNTMNRDIIETGSASIERASQSGGKVKSTETLSIILKGMHLQNNL